MLVTHAKTLLAKGIPLYADWHSGGQEARTNMRVDQISDNTLGIAELDATEIPHMAGPQGHLDDIAYAEGSLTVYLADEEDPVALLLDLGFSEQDVARMAGAPESVTDRSAP